jgi:hypothetical protein
MRSVWHNLRRKKGRNGCAKLRGWQWGSEQALNGKMSEGSGKEKGRAPST